ncbi:MAG: glycosyltransferase family 2 protein, partial [Patescibacteria group bacterium]|nr:glycosyltransferase family 2 protein [Patescibacteria group bacterium]
IIVNFNTSKLTCECIDSIIKHTEGINYEIIVVDNNSHDDSLKRFKRYKKKKEINFKLIANSKNYGFGYANNQGIEACDPSSGYVLFLNSDTKLFSNVVKKMFVILEKRKDIGVISCQLLNKDGSIQQNGGYFPTLIRVFSWMIIQDLPYVDKIIKPFHPKTNNFYNVERDLDWVTGAFFMVRKSVIDQCGMFDTDYFMYAEDTDYCYRIRKAGWRILYTPSAAIIHYGGASGENWSFVCREFEGIKTFYKKHYPKWQLPILKLLLKIGSLLRFIFYTVKINPLAAQSYVKAFSQA